jgi:hypothetical protein
MSDNPTPGAEKPKEAPKVVEKTAAAKKRSAAKKAPPPEKSTKTVSKKTKATKLVVPPEHEDTDEETDDERETHEEHDPQHESAEKDDEAMTALSVVKALKKLLSGESIKEEEEEDELLSEIRQRLSSKFELPKAVTSRDLRILKEAWLWPLVFRSEENTITIGMLEDEFRNEEKFTLAVRRRLERAYGSLDSAVTANSINIIMKHFQNIALTTLEWPETDSAPRLCDRIESWVTAAQKEIDRLDARIIEQGAGHRASSAYLRSRDTFSLGDYPLTAALALKKASYGNGEKRDGEKRSGEKGKSDGSKRKCNRCGEHVPIGTSFAAHRKEKKC